MNDNDRTAGSNTADSIYAAPETEVSVAPADDLLAAYVGPKNTDYYKRHFDRFEQGASVSWNWPAFFLTSFWLLYRKMWLWAFLYWIVLPIALVAVEVVVGLSTNALVGSLTYWVLYLLIGFVVVPMFATLLYHRHARGKVDTVTTMIASEEQQAAELDRIGGTSNVVLVVLPIFLVAVIGILAAIAIPAYQDYEVRAQVAEGLALSAVAKAAVAESYIDTGQFPTDNAAVGLDEPATYNGLYVDAVGVNDGTVFVIYRGDAHPLLRGRRLELDMRPAGQDRVEWVCSSPDIDDRHLPAACRQ